MKLAAMMGPMGLALAALGASPARAMPYTFTQLPISAGALNNAGQVLGLSSIPNTFGYGFNIELYDHGVAKLLDYAPVGKFNNFLSVSGINDSGLIIGSASTTHYSEPFAYLNGVPFNLGPVVGTTDAFLNAVNDKGEIVGLTGFYFGPLYGFLLSNGVVTTITVPGPPRYPGDVNPLPTAPTGINNLDQIVGTYNPGPFDNSKGFLLSGGVYSPIIVPGSAQTRPVAINDSGEVVGTFNDAAGTQHGFEEENNVFSPIIGPDGGDFPADWLEQPAPNRRQHGRHGQGPTYLATPQAAPEPSSLALLCAGLTGLFGWRARGRRGSTRH